MLTKKEIEKYLLELNTSLKEEEEVGEIGLIGGAVMCLVYNARLSTKDVDAVFQPSLVLRKHIQKIALKYDLKDDWLNDAAKGFLVENFSREVLYNYSNLKVWVPETAYMLAMKCISARWDTHDQSDVKVLIRELQLQKAKDVFQIIENYYPKKQIPAKTQFLIEEIFDKDT